MSPELYVECCSGTIPKGDIGNASEIYNFLRNIGGSVGISAATTIDQRHLQTHRNENSHWLSGGSWILQRALHLLTLRMQMHAGPHRATLWAFSTLQTALNSQSQLWAYVDDFRYMALLCVLCIPLAFILKKHQAAAKQQVDKLVPLG